MTQGIYKIECVVSKRKYVGSSVNIERRWGKHKALLNVGIHHSIILQNAWTLYKATSFNFTIIEVVKQTKNLVVREQFWIDKLECFGKKGYNVAPKAGSSRGRKLTAAHKAKIAFGNLGRIVNEATRVKISLANTGKRRTTKAKAKMSDAAKKRGAHSSEVYAAISELNRGKTRTLEQRKKISDSRKGKPLSEQHKEALKQAWVKRKERISNEATISRHSKRVVGFELPIIC
jgi:group I intron endonuclease